MGARRGACFGAAWIICGAYYATNYAKLIALSLDKLSNFCPVLRLVLSRKEDFEVGSGQAAKRGAKLWLYVITFASIPAILFLGIGRPFPVGEAATVPYILAGLIIALLVLTG